MSKICKCQLVLAFVLLVYGMNAQVIFRGDTSFFGPCLRFSPVDELHLFSNGNTIRINDCAIYIDYFDCLDATNNKSVSEVLKRIYGESTSDRIGITKSKAVLINGLKYKLKKYSTYAEKENNIKRRRIRKESFYSLSIDTVLFESVRVLMEEQQKNLREVRKMIKDLKNVYVVNPIDYPRSQFVIPVDAICEENAKILFDKEFLVTSLPCMSVELIKEDYIDFYNSDIDSLLEDFAYAQIADTLEERFIRKRKEEWNCQKDAFEYLFGGKDVSFQKEIQMHQMLFNLEVGVNEFMNYKKQLSQTTFFDTLHLIRFCNKRLVSNFERYNSFTRLNDVCKYSRPYTLRDIAKADEKLNMDYLLRDYLIRKYFGKSDRQMQVVTLLSDKYQEIYGIWPESQASGQGFLAHVYQESMGEWNIKIDTLNKWNANYKVDSLFYFNGTISFAAGKDFLIMDAGEGGHAQLIKSFPDSLPGFNYIAHVKNTSELFNDHFEMEFFLNFPENDYRRKNKLGYSIINKKELEFKSIKRGDYANGESIFIHKGKGDLDRDGIEEIYAYGISDGKVIFAHGYTTRNEKLIELKGDELLEKLKFSILFNDVLLYSQIDNGNE